MASLELRDLFTVAQFIKARCQHGLKAKVSTDKNYIFYEVDIRDAKTKGHLCFLDKVKAESVSDSAWGSGTVVAKLAYRERESFKENLF